MTTGRINQVTWWRKHWLQFENQNQWFLWEVYKKCKHYKVKLASPYFLLIRKKINETERNIFSKRNSHHQTFLRLKSITNSCCRCNSHVIRRVTSCTECDSTISLCWIAHSKCCEQLCWLNNSSICLDRCSC